MTVRLGLRLAVAGGRESLLRLAERSGWQSADPDTPATAPDPALFLTVTDYHQGTAMIRGYMAALGPRPPVPPGLERLPGPGEVAVSPAMRRLFESTPDDELDDRYPGRVIATIGDEGLAHPDQLVALIGRTPDQLGEVSSRSLYRVRGFGSLSGRVGLADTDLPISIERRRPFALLRASGLRLGEVRQVVLLETVAAMLGHRGGGVGLGMASSYALALFSDMAWRWPDGGVFAMVGIGVLAALVLSTVALPLLDVATRHDAVRYG